ncbi:MAG: acyltransferase, partial [Gammaproteobacteria bacterium]
MNGLRIFGKGKVNIGNNFHSGRGVKIYTQSHNHKGDKIPYDRSTKLYEINIGDNVWLGDDVKIVG